MQLDHNRIEELANKLGAIHAPVPVAGSPLDWLKSNDNPFDVPKLEDYDSIRGKQKIYVAAITPIIINAVKQKIEAETFVSIFLVVNTRKPERSYVVTQLPFVNKTFHFLKAETIVVNIDTLKIINNIIV